MINLRTKYIIISSLFLLCLVLGTFFAVFFAASSNKQYKLQLSLLDTIHARDQFFKELKLKNTEDQIESKLLTQKEVIDKAIEFQASLSVLSKQLTSLVRRKELDIEKLVKIEKIKDTLNLFVENSHSDLENKIFDQNAFLAKANLEFYEFSDLFHSLKTIVADDAQKKKSQIVGFSMFILLASLVIFGFYFFASKQWSSKLDHMLNKLILESSHTHSASSNLKDTTGTAVSLAKNLTTEIQKILSSLQAVAASLTKTSRQTDIVRKHIDNIKRRAHQSTKIMEKLVKTMHSIEGANKSVQDIEEIIREISGKTQIVNQIVFKTQLLSFNASIEASRAGHHGRGFAVVADEIGNLAKMSGAAAKEIEDLIENSKLQVKNVLRNNKETVSEGIFVSNEAQRELLEIAKETLTTSELVLDVNLASAEQSSGLHQSVHHLRNLSNSFEGSFSSISGATQISKVLKNHSRILKKISENISVVIYGQKSEDMKKLRNEDETIPTPKKTA